MTRLDSSSEGTAAPRKRGAPNGNRNAWKHGARSAAAKAERAAVRGRRVASLPDARVLQPSLALADGVYAQIAANARRAQNSPNKTNNSVSHAPEGEGGADSPPNKTNNSDWDLPGGDPPPVFSPNKTNNSNKANNSVADELQRKRGAPKGNKNALKHGMKSAERRAFNSGLRQFLRRIHATCGLANAIAVARSRGA